MLLSQSIKSSSYLQAHTDESIRTVYETGNSLVITQKGEAKAVLMDIRTFEGLQDTVALLKIIAMSEKDVQEGKVEEASAVFADMRAELERE